MTEHFETALSAGRPVSECRALVRYAPPAARQPVAPAPAPAPGHAADQATQIAQAAQAETARRRRRSSPDRAISSYRAGRALTEAPNLTRLVTL
jgi:hypothetical protein